MSHRLLIPLSAALAAASAAAPARLPAPETKVEGYRFVVEQVQQQQYQQADFPAGGQENASTMLAGKQLIYVRLAVIPPDSKLLPNIEAVGAEVKANIGKDKPIMMRSYPSDDSPAAGGAWRTQLMAQEVELSADRITNLKGDLIVYPKARVVSLEFPVNAKLPLTKSIDGMKATLRSVRERNGSLTVGVDTEWPSSLSVTRSNSDAPNGVTALTKTGLVLIPSGGNSSPNEKNGVLTRQHNLTFMDIKEPPDRIRVEALVRSGGARRIPFTLPEIPLPDSLPADPDPSQAMADGSPLGPGHPLYAKDGGRLTAPLRGKTDGGRLLLGLSREEGPWRWAPPASQTADSASLGQLRPGSYRVVVAWAPADPDPPARPVRIGSVMKVEIVAGKTAILTPVQAPEER